MYSYTWRLCHFFIKAKAENISIDRILEKMSSVCAMQFLKHKSSGFFHVSNGSSDQLIRIFHSRNLEVIVGADVAFA